MAMPAGISYIGGTGVASARQIRPVMVSSQGAGVRENIADAWLAGAGLQSRGGVNGYALARSPRLGRLGDACTDDGAVAARGAIGGAGAGFSTIAAGTHDSGWQTAGGVVEALTGTVSAIWGSVCQAQAARAGGASTPGAGTATDPSVAAAIASIAASQEADRVARRQDQIRAQQAAAQQQRMMLIGGGVLAVLVLGGVAVAVLRR